MSSCVISSEQSVMIHVVDAAGTEGRDPVDDIYKINAELEALQSRNCGTSAGNRSQ